MARQTFGGLDPAKQRRRRFKGAALLLAHRYLVARGVPVTACPGEASVPLLSGTDLWGMKAQPVNSGKRLMDWLRREVVFGANIPL